MSAELFENTHRRRMLNNFIGARLPTVEDVWLDCRSSVFHGWQKFTNLEDSSDTSSSVSEHNNIEMDTSQQVSRNFNRWVNQTINSLSNRISVHRSIHRVTGVHRFKQD